MNLKKSLLGIAAVAALCIGSIAFAAPAMADYSAIAMSDYGSFSGFARDYATANKAVAEAEALCEQQAGDGNCETSFTWEDSSWFYAGITCDQGTFTGASPQGYGSAEQFTYKKARLAHYTNCWTVVRMH